MAFDKLNFSKNWENAEDFPTFEQDEAQVRKDMQVLHDETKAYLNETLLPQMEQELDGKANDNNVLHKDETEAFTPTLDTHPATKKYVDEVATQMAAGSLPDQSVTPIKMADSFWDVVYQKDAVYNKDELVNVVYKKEEVYNKDETYSKDEANALLAKKANQSSLNETNETVATKASKEEAQLFGYGGKLYRLELDLDAPWVYTKGLSIGTNYQVCRSDKYIAKFTPTAQEFYDRETGDLLASNTATLYYGDYEYYFNFDWYNYDDNLFIGRMYSYDYFFNPQNGLYYSVYAGNKTNYLGCSDGYAYYATYPSSLQFSVYAINLSTMKQDSSKTKTYTMTYANPQIYRDMNVYSLSITNSTLYFETINVLTGTRSSKSITSTSSDAYVNSVFWIDTDNCEIYFSGRLTAKTDSDYGYAEYYLHKYNYSTNVCTVLSTDFWCHYYAGHLDEDTVLFRDYRPSSGNEDFTITQGLVKFKLSTGEVLGDTYDKGENYYNYLSYQLTTVYCGKPIYHDSGRFVALGNYLLDTDTMYFYTLRTKNSAFATDFTTTYSMQPSHGGPVLYYNTDYWDYTPFDYFELNDRVGFSPVFAKEVT